MINGSTNRYRIPNIFKDLPGLIAAESLRHGGVSSEPFHSLNLSYYTTDKKANVKKNRQLFFNDLGISEKQVAGSFQVHHSALLIVDEPGQYDKFDALITNNVGIFLSISIADCTPVLIYDERKKVVGAAHAGWKGTSSTIASYTLRAMKGQFGSNPLDCMAYIGTCIDADCYEVDNDVARYFPSRFKLWDPDRSKFLINLKESNRVQLMQAGIPETQIEVSPYCTYKNNSDYFSHRKENGKTGRSLCLIGLS